ncbi:unnamed protein product, partial [Pleuronectes platessa]
LFSITQDLCSFAEELYSNQMTLHMGTQKEEEGDSGGLGEGEPVEVGAAQGLIHCLLTGPSGAVLIVMGKAHISSTHTSCASPRIVQQIRAGEQTAVKALQAQLSKLRDFQHNNSGMVWGGQRKTVDVELTRSSDSDSHRHCPLCCLASALITDLPQPHASHVSPHIQEEQ